MSAPGIINDNSLIAADIQNYIGFGAIVLLMLLIIIALLVILRAFNIVTRLVLKADGLTDEQISVAMNPVKPKKKKNQKARFGTNYFP